MSPKSTVSTARRKPAKPYEGYPMFAHPSGQWAKKMKDGPNGKSKLFYFGVWADPEAALARLNREWPYIREGKTPPSVDVSGGCTLRQLCNNFLESKAEKLKVRDLSPRTFRDYHKTCEGLLNHFGKDRRVEDLQPADFRPFRAKLSKRLGVTSLKNEINRCYILFNYAHENKLIEKPVSYGQSFDRPSAKAIRRTRNEAGPKLFEREELLRILDALAGKEVTTERKDKETGKPEKVKLTANPALRAMVLLGANCGFGNTDVASLPRKAVNLQTGWIDFPRPKTEIPRRVPLWPETIAALKEAIPLRPAPEDASGKGCCFLTRQGRPWVRVKVKGEKATEAKAEADGKEEKIGPEASVPIDALSGEFKKVLHKLNINGRRGLGFYTLRHVFETQAGESKDQVAVDSIMGHVDPSMAATYRERISDERLRAVVDTVRRWLFSPTPEVIKEGGAS